MAKVVDLFGQECVPLIKKKEAIKAQIEIKDKPKREPVYIEVIKLFPHFTVTYGQEITGFFSGRKNDMPKFNKPNYKISDRARRRLGNALNWMILFSTPKTVYSKKEKKKFTFRINFITLTLSDIQLHSDHYIKQHLLAPFLKWMERSHNCQSYVWKAEAQENGNIHFHITTNQFIHWKQVRAKWNRLLAKHGYCKVFQDGTNDKGNAATQIKAVKGLNGIVAYMQKYICKPDFMKKNLSESCPLDGGVYTKKNYWQIECSDNMTKEYKRGIEGKMWSTSHNLSKISCFISMEDGHDYFQAANNILSKSKVVRADQFMTVRAHSTFRSKDMHPLLVERLKQVRETHFSNNYQPRKIEIESFY